MALIPRSGSLEPTSQAKIEPHVTPGEITKNIDGNRFFLPQDGLLTNEKIVKDTLTNQTAWNVDRWADSICELFGYTDGFGIAVTYFNQDLDDSNARNNPTDVSTGTDHVIHKNLIKIYNLELRFINGIDYQYDKDENIMTATASCYTPPGFYVYKGDLFYLLLQDGKWGVFAVREIERLAISQATFFKCDVELVQFLTVQYQEYIEQSVIDTRFFDKQKYLLNNMTLLTTKSWKQLVDIKQLKRELINRYIDLFYNEECSSFIRNDGIYDPYVVEFWHKKVSTADHLIRPMQLVPELNDYQKSVWSCFTDKNYPNDPFLRKKYYDYIFRNNHLWHAGITPLIHRRYVVLRRDTDPVYFGEMDPVLDNDKKTYIFSKGFYSGDSSNMLLHERWIHETLGGIVNPDIYLNFLNNYKSWTDEFSFYFMPIGLYLLDLSYYNVVD